MIHRQLALKDGTSASWAIHAAKLLRQYDLPSPFYLLRNPPGKQNFGWKKQVKDAIRKYWLTNLLRETRCRVTARFISRYSSTPGQVHPVWGLTPCTSYDMQQAYVKVKMISGAYWLGADLVKSNIPTSTICQLCNLETETLEHMVTRCTAYHEIRDLYFPVIKRTLIQLYGREAYEKSIRSDASILRTILDPNLIIDVKKPQTHDTRLYFEHVTRKYLYQIHNRRVVTLGAMHSNGNA